MFQDAPRASQDAPRASQDAPRYSQKAFERASFSPCACPPKKSCTGESPLIAKDPIICDDIEMAWGQVVRSIDFSRSPGPSSPANPLSLSPKARIFAFAKITINRPKRTENRSVRQDFLTKITALMRRIFW